MLKMCHSMSQLDLEQLAAVYELGPRQASEFFDYLRRMFFQTKGARYCILEEQGEYVSALRLEPYRDGLILTGLQTPTAHRGKGFATELVGLTLAGLQGVRLYSHIDHRNRASIAVHEGVGFRQISDTAVLLDGSATSRAGTYLIEL